MNEVNLTEKELLEMPKEDLVGMVLGMQSSFNEMKRTIDLLSEKVNIMNQRSYGRKSEVVSPLQLELELGLNEAEALADPEEKEPTLEEVAPRKKRPVGKRKDDLEKITEHKTIPVEIPEEELNSRFGEGNWKRLPDQIITKLEHIPASFVAVTYKIGVYAAKDNQTIIRADKPYELWQNSIATPSLVASIMFSKYINAVPLYRQEQAYADNNVNISRATMANWMIAASEKYLKYYCEAMHKKRIEQKYLHADETRVEVSKDGRKTGAQSYMWVYRSRKKEGVPQIVLYDYQKTRSTEHPENFLKGFKGTLSTDGYEVYHRLERKDPVCFKVCGCWVHAKRKFTEVVKADDSKPKYALANKAVKMISKIFYENKKLDDLTAEERLESRQKKIKPMVDEYFIWVKKNQRYVNPESKTGQAFTYSVNQEQYLRVFLEDPELSMDNNLAEQAIRPFTLGRKNWVMIDTIKGAEASAVLYSLAETSRANGLRSYEYFSYLLTELPKYIHDFETEIPESLFPWSEDFPKELFR